MLILLARHCEGEARSNLPPKTSPNPSKGGELLPSLMGRGWERGSGLLRLTARNDVQVKLT